MTTNTAEPSGDDPEGKHNTTLAPAARGNEPQVAGRLDTYRSRSSKWHRQVRVETCPKCGHPHLHRAPLPLVRSVRKTAPCGQLYVVVLRPTAVGA
ncbi:MULTISPECIES: hypothetical protein [unclassified Streptomyces]|uniref:hypothetical protein n=1 Tax=unclassified Streptomyces TaxID=2593676 RepID=UPI00380609DC